MTPGPPRTARTKTTLIWALTGIALILFVAFFVFFSIRSDSEPSIPEIPTQSLDPSVVRLLHKMQSNVKVSPRDDMAWGTLGMMLRAHDYPREASVCFLQAQKLNPDEPRWPYHLAHTLMNGDQEDALRQLRRAVVLCGNQYDYPRLWLGRLLLERGRLEEAEGIVSPWLRSEPNHAGARLLQAQMQFARQNWESSARSLMVCVTNRFTARQAYALLGQVYLRLDRGQDSVTANQVVKSLPDDDPWPDPFEQELTQFRVSRRHLIESVPILLAQNELAEAKRLTDQLLLDYPEAAEGWLYQGRLHYLNQDWPAAEKALLHHLELEPESVDGLMQLGQLRMMQNQPELAIDSLGHVARLKPDAHIAHYQLGEARWRSGETNAAIQSFRDAIRCEPAFLESYLRLANLYYKTGRKEEAIQQLNQAMQIDPSDMRVQEGLEYLQGE